MVVVALSEWQVRAPLLAAAAVVGVVVTTGKSFFQSAGGDCFNFKFDSGFPTPLDEETRCNARFLHLNEAQAACKANSDCSGIGHDHGIDCGGKKMFELKKGEAVDDKGSISWIAGSCAAEEKPTWPGTAEEVKAIVASSFAGFREVRKGVMTYTVEKGTALPLDSGRREMHFVGYLFDGKEFRNTYDKDLNPEGKPFTYAMDSVIEGWQIGMDDMFKGEKRVILVPPEYAYGEKGDAISGVPKDAWVIFFMELVGDAGHSCENTCLCHEHDDMYHVEFANNGECNDGGVSTKAGQRYGQTICRLGTDCADCGPRG